MSSIYPIEILAKVGPKRDQNANPSVRQNIMSFKTQLDFFCGSFHKLNKNFFLKEGLSILYSRSVLILIFSSKGTFENKLLTLKNNIQVFSEFSFLISSTKVKKSLTV